MQVSFTHAVLFHFLFCVLGLDSCLVQMSHILNHQKSCLVAMQNYIYFYCIGFLIVFMHEIRCNRWWKIIG